MAGNIAFKILFLYVVLQGAVRKWMAPSLGTPLFLLMFVLLFTFYMVAKGTREKFQPSIKPAFQGVLMLYLGYCFLEMANLRATNNVIVPVYGFIMHFAFVPLIYKVTTVFQHQENFEKYINWLVLVMIPMGFLGVTQYFSPPGSFINRYAVDMAEGTYEIAIGGGGRARITGTFPYLATFASFLNFILHLLFYATVISLIRGKLNIKAFGAFGLGIVNLFMTGSRGSTVLYGATEVLVIGMLVASGEAKFLKKIIPLALMLGGGYFIIQFTEAGSTAMTDFFARLLGLNDVEGRLDDAWAPFKYIEQCGAIGFGLGTGQFPMVSYLVNKWEMPPYWEEEGERIVLELGAVGFILVMILRIMVVLACYKIYRSIKKIEWKILALQMTVYQLPFLLNIQTNIFNYIEGLFYWLAVGIVYFAWSMDVKERNKMKEEAVTADTRIPI